VSLGVVLAGCSEAGQTLLQPEEIPSASADLAQSAADPPAPVLAFSDLSVVGTSRIIRTPNGVNFQVKTTGLTPGHAVTLWFVVLNAPAECTFGGPGVCGPTDVVNDLARPDMMWAAGRIIGGSGEATFSGRRRVGDGSGSANGPVGLPAYGLEDAYGAEVQLVVHDHGPKMPQYMPDMIKSIDGGCTDAGVPAAGVPSPWNDYAGGPTGGFGRRGTNTCQSIQFAVHTAP
jgi:hypothetical protein